MDPSADPDAKCSIDLSSSEPDTATVSVPALPVGVLLVGPRFAIFIFFLFTLFNTLDNADRVVLAGSGEAVTAFLQADLRTNAADAAFGSLTSAFIVGFTISAVIVGQLSTRWPRQNLVILAALGILWCASILICATADTYVALLVGRAMSGLGEAGWLTVAPPILQDLAPSGFQGMWISTYFMSVPVGVSVGFFLGGLISPKYGWHAVFQVELVIAIPLAIALCVVACIARDRRRQAPGVGVTAVEEADDRSLLDASAVGTPRMGSQGSSLADDGSKEAGSTRLALAAPGVLGQACAAARDAGLLVLRPHYLCLVLGGAGWQAVNSAWSAFTPLYIRYLEILGSQQEASVTMSIITLVAGVVGPIASGMLLERLRLQRGRCCGPANCCCRASQGAATPLVATQAAAAARGSSSASENGTTTCWLPLPSALRRWVAASPPPSPDLPLMLTYLCPAISVALALLLAVPVASMFGAAPYFTVLSMYALMATSLVAPYQAAVMAAVAPAERSLALGLGQLIIHVLGDVPFPAIVGWALDAFAPAICAAAQDAASNVTATAADAGGRLLGGVADRGRCTHDANGVRAAITIAHGWDIWPVLFWAAAMYFSRHALTLAAASAASASSASGATASAAQDRSRGQGEGAVAEGVAAEEVQGGHGRGGRYGTDVPPETRLLTPLAVPDAPAAH